MIVTLTPAVGVAERGVDRAFLRRAWREACEKANIKPVQVGISDDRSVVHLAATRDGREGSTATLPAQFVTQPGAKYLLLGVALQLVEAWDKLNKDQADPKIIVDIGAAR